MKSKLLVLSAFALLGLSQIATAADAINSSKIANGEGSSSSLTCLQDPNCK